MGMVAWVLLGLIVGAAAKLLRRPRSNRAGEGRTLLLAGGGALVTGYLGHLLGFYDRTTNVAGALAAVFGAAASLAIYHHLAKRRQ